MGKMGVIILGILLEVNELYLTVKLNEIYIDFVFIMILIYLVMFILKNKGKVPKKKINVLNINRNTSRNAEIKNLSTTSINQNNLVKKTKKNENNISYLKKLEKIKVERKLQIERKFQKDHKQ